MSELKNDKSVAETPHTIDDFVLETPNTIFSATWQEESDENGVWVYNDINDNTSEEVLSSNRKDG